MWKQVSQGTSFSNLSTAIQDIELKKGARMRIVMDAPGSDWLFDIAGAEWVFRAVTPPGMDVVDVWGENGQGICELEADPAWLVATLLFVKAHWLALIIAGILVVSVVSFIRIMLWVAVASTPFPAFLIVAVVFGAILLMPRYKPLSAKADSFSLPSPTGGG